MPATEETRYDMKRLHKLFAVASMLLMLATVWMFARDHFREWKTIQRTGERIETRLAQWQQQQLLTNDVASERKRLQQALAEQLAKPFSITIVEQYRSEVRADAKRRGAATPSFEELDRAFAELEDVAVSAQAARNRWLDQQLEADKVRLQAEDAAVRARDDAGTETPVLEQAVLERAALERAAASRQAETLLAGVEREMHDAEAAVVPARKRVLGELETWITAARFREAHWIRLRKSELAKLDVDKASLGLSARDQASDADLMRVQDQIDQRQRRVDELTLEAEAATAHRERLRQLRARLLGDEAAIRKRLDENAAETERLEKVVVENRSTYFNFWGIVPLPGKKWLELPILDAFNSPRKIENLWSEGLDRPAGSFGRVARFDRCTTCHQRMQESLPDEPARPALGTPVTVDLALSLPATLPDGIIEEPKTGENGKLAVTDQQLKSLFGFALASEGLLRPEEVTIQWVDPHGVAACARVWDDIGKSMRAGDIRMQLLQVGQAGRQDSEVADSKVAGSETVDSMVAGLLVGDVIVAINGQDVPADCDGRQWVTERMLGAASARAGDQPLRLRVRRGLTNPFAGHPRLDLFVSERSPHAMARFGCTVCHEGQGSATSFQWASHTPNDVATRGRWRQQYDWSENRHWIYPMAPRRFVESSCLKCHHDVVELERSERFPETPAPRLTAGYRLIRTLGCFGCHEIQGHRGEERRIGPDLRLEPNYHAAALQFKGAPGTGYAKLTAHERAVVDRLIQEPDNESARQALLTMWRDDARNAGARSPAAVLAAAEQGSRLAASDAVDSDAVNGHFGPGEHAAAPRFSEMVRRRLLPLLQRQETPGTLRKVGPTLRFVGHKLDAAFLRDWIRQPSRFRPSTRMPQAFGLWKHLPAEQLRARIVALKRELAGDDGPRPGARARGAAEIQADLDAVKAELQRIDEVEKRFEPIAIYSMVHYLRQRTQVYEYTQPPDGITPIVSDEDKRSQVERGRVAFQELGCLACHDHADFPEIEHYRDPDFVVEGPDLSDLASKFSAARDSAGPKWLYSWIVQPTRYSTRTMMPELMIQPVEHRDDDGNVVSVTDPVADLVAYLLSGLAGDWRPSDEVPDQLDEQDRRVLQELTLTYLKDMFPSAVAQRYMRDGIPFAEREKLRGAERELVVRPSEEGKLAATHMIDKRIAYVAQKAFANGGCFACHDIPGMEDAKPIGPGLNDWGRKDIALLAFGHVAQYVQRNRTVRIGASSDGASADVSTEDRKATALGSANASVFEEGEAADPIDGNKESSAYFQGQLEARSRIGFINQKLTEPRSFDYIEARNKKYTGRLQMPQFALTADQRESIMTFVLGLVADPPSAKYVFTPDAGTKALLAGQEVLTKYSCRGCHILETEQWDLAFAPDHYGDREGASTYPFVSQAFDQGQRTQSRRVDRRGVRHARIRGMPALSDDGLPMILDDEEFPIEEEEDESFELDRLIYSFDLWQPALVDGHPYQMGDGTLDVPAENLARRHRAYGGALPKYLLPRVVEREKQVNPNAKGGEAWAWLPPVLVGEGSKVQPEWLYNYLLEPHPIRPAVVMRMPKYNMSRLEASQLVDYFAARDRARYPYDLEPVRQPQHLVDADRKYARALAESSKESEQGKSDGGLVGRHLNDAMRIVVDSNYCVKCHLIGDYNPPGIERVKAPDLAAVHQRLRSDYLRKWLAKPTALQPYTPMPVNIPYNLTAPLQGTTVPQSLYRGTSTQQLDALVDLLMNYDRYLQQHVPISVAPQGE